MGEFKDIKELLKYCFLMQEYRQTQNKKKAVVDQQNMNIEVDLYLPFSIENNVDLRKTCRLVENQLYIEISTTDSDTASKKKLVIESLTKYIDLVDKINGEPTIIVYYFFLRTYLHQWQIRSI